MNVKGKHILQADVATIWPMLQDEEVLARISPGVSKVEKVGDDQFRAISDISIGPVRGSFEGDLALMDKVEHETMTLTLSQKSKIGNATATIVMNLNPLSDVQTEIKYNGSAKVSGRLATMGQRILGGVISTLSKQVFKELEKVIEERQADGTLSDAVSASENVRIETGQDALLDQQSQESQQSKLETINSSAIEVKEKIAETVLTEDHLHRAPTTPVEGSEIRKSFFQIIIDKLKSIWK